MSFVLDTMIKEEQPTVNKHLYRKGSLEKIKEKLEDSISNKTCFVTIGHSSQSGDELIMTGNVAGYVTDFKIEDGQGKLEIEPELHFPAGQVFNSYMENGLNLKADFRLQSVLEDNHDEDGNYYVSMDDFGVENILAVVLDESKD